MIKSYLITALRTLRRQRSYTVLNVLGLTLGMTCCLLLFGYVAYETSFDRFHEKKDRIVRAANTETRNGETGGTQSNVGYVFGPTMAREVPGIVRFARVHPNYGDAVLSYRDSAERTFLEDGVVYVDSTFLSLFSFPLVEGDPARALTEPQTLLVSESVARRYFGDDEPVGKTLQFEGWVRGAYTVAGVFEDVPPTSHLQFDVLVPMEDLLAGGRFDEGDAPWGWQNFVTYFELDPAADREAVEAAVTERYMHHRRDVLATTNTTATAYLQPLPDIHLDDTVTGPAAVTGSRRSVRFFGLIGLITLVIALVNYVNLATARAMDRATEVGVRKVVGARRRQLVGQFLLESALLNALALGLAVIAAGMLLPVVNEVAGVEMTSSLWLDARLWTAFLGVFVAGALGAGLYPAFVLSSFQPVTVLKGKAQSLASGMTLRKVLVVAQFAASIALLTGTAVVYAQLRYMRGLDTGLELERVLVVEGPQVRSPGADGAARAAEMAALKSELREIPAVQAVGLSSTTPGRGFQWYTELWRAAAAPSTAQPVRGTFVDAGFAEVYGLELTAGEGFYDGFVRPDSGAQPVVVNETFVRRLGFTSNEAALGELVTGGGGGLFTVRGVVEDFRWSSAHQEAEAVLFLYETRRGALSMKVSTADLPGTLAQVQAAYEALFPGNPFVYAFADAAFDEQYRSDRRFSTLFSAFTGVAILIACLGLFGLASLVVARRTKEIGVRKVLGASAGSIAALVSRDFLVLVGIAFVLAAPAAYVYLRGWLDGFAYPIELGPGLFLLAGAVALGVALVTVSAQAFRAATMDPARSLRSE